MNANDMALLAYIRVCAKKYPQMTVARMVELAEEMAKEIVTGALKIEEKKPKKPCAKSSSPPPKKPSKPVKKPEVAKQAHARAIANGANKKRTEVLNLIVELYGKKLTTTRKELMKRVGLSQTALQYHLNKLVNDGLIVSHPSNAGFYYTPCEDLIVKEPLKKVGKVTFCPTRYATGYGINNKPIGGGIN